MRNVLLSNACLEGSMFYNVDAEGAIFGHANLFNSNFAGVNLRGTSFVGAKGYNLAHASCVKDCRKMRIMMDLLIGSYMNQCSI
ncbi:hypothetical protein ACFX1R_006853 [Malus domestica]